MPQWRDLPATVATAAGVVSACAGGVAPLHEIPVRDVAVVAVNASSKSACVLDIRGNVLCWGAVADDHDSTVPEQVQLPRPATDLAEESCAILDDGTVWCWWLSRYCQHSGAAIASRAPFARSRYCPMPAQVGGVVNAVAFLSRQSWAVRSTDGAVWRISLSDFMYHLDQGSSGATTDGECVVTGGRAKCLCANEPVQDWIVNCKDGPFSFTSNVIDASLTGCLLLGDGRVMCRGANDELQTGVSSDHKAIVPEFTVVPIPHAYTIYSPAWHTVCADTRSAGMWCWGDAQSLPIDRTATGCKACGTGKCTPCTGPRQLPFGGAQVSLGGPLISCARMSAERVVCWGDNNDYGQLGPR